jgi:arginine deiminase
VLFHKGIVDKVSVVNIPAERAYMHIDTIFTQIRRDMWVMYAPFTREAIALSKEEIDFRRMLDDEMETPEEQVYVTQFVRKPNKDGFKVQKTELDYLDDLLIQVSKEDFGCSTSGNCPQRKRHVFHSPSANSGLTRAIFLPCAKVLSLDMTAMWKPTNRCANAALKSLRPKSFLSEMDAGAKLDDVITGDTLILLPSAELSRARGGTHCMSMPLAARRNLNTTSMQDYFSHFNDPASGVQL